MSTNDVPGANPANADELKMGCWAEHRDGSLILVESTEASRIIYSIFDMAAAPARVIEYRDAMPETSFKSTFSWDSTGKKSMNEKWTWHDKTPFPWDRIIKGGAKDGARAASAQHVLNAAQEIMESRNRHETAAARVADALALEGEELDKRSFEHRMEKTLSRVGGILEKLTGALDKLPGAQKKKTEKRAGTRK